MLIEALRIIQSHRGATQLIERISNPGHRPTAEPPASAQRGYTCNPPPAAAGPQARNKLCNPACCNPWRVPTNFWKTFGAWMPLAGRMPAKDRRGRNAYTSPQTGVTDRENGMAAAAGYLLLGMISVLAGLALALPG